MPYSTRDLGGLRAAMIETRRPTQEPERIDYRIAVSCSKCKRNVTIVKAALCADVRCPRLFGALRALEMNERGSYAGRCTYCRGEVSGRDEYCRRCSAPKPFLYEYELKEGRL